MTQQMTMQGLDGIGRVISADLNQEMQQSYLEYAMSVIVGRALPEVRDGLKPVHRRILYAMHELGLTPDRPFRKCARVVGDVLGKYHPHGDQAVYDALVRMAQDFSSRYPLISGHGNFGSIDNDPPAAMRYTECRLASLGERALLSDIGDDIVEFMPNFDESQLEPTILPAQLPLLLLNGSSGIAVGMATNIPPHNLSELVDGLLLMIDKPNCSLEDLMTKIPAPDFPTGGQIIGDTGILEAYSTGRGSIAVRGLTQFEEIHPGKGRHRRNAIIITEFPYQVNKAAWLEKVAELVNQDRITGITDLRDESDRTGIRVVVELRKDANPQAVLNQLFKLTPLQNNFGVILLALVNGEPKQMGLQEILQHFLRFRETTLTRIFQSELERVQRKAAEVEGMLLALSHLDTVIDLLRHARDGSTAKQQLQEVLECTALQADTILAMPMRRLTGLEQEKLQSEFTTLQARIQELEGLLQDRRKLLNFMKKELRDIKKTYGDPRRTLLKTKDEIKAEELKIPDPTQEKATNVILQFTQKGYLRRLPVPSRRSRSSHRDLHSDDHVIDEMLAQLNHELVVLTALGRAYTIKVSDIPISTGQARGTPLVTLLPVSETVIAAFIVDPGIQDQHLIVLSQKGRLKRVLLSELTGLTSRGSTVLKLKDDDELGWALTYHPTLTDTCSLVVATSGGRLLRLPLDDLQIPLMGRTAMGNQALRLHKKESIAGMVVAQPDSDIVLGTRAGFLKRIPVEDYTQVERGAIGTQAIQFKRKTDSLVSLAPATDPNLNRLLFISASGQVVAESSETIPLEDRTGTGIQLFKLASGDSLAQIRPIPNEEAILQSS